MPLATAKAVSLPHIERNRVSIALQLIARLGITATGTATLTQVVVTAISYFPDLKQDTLIIKKIRN
jgi:hypothetical protein